MPTIIHKLKEKDKRKDWVRLREMYEGAFLHGKCYEFAIALHQGLGWPMVGLFVKKPGMDCVDHAGVRSPEGRTFDIRGFVSEEEFGSPYTNPPYDVREVTKEDLNVIAPVGEYVIQRARRVAEVLWPELPWMKTHVSEIIAFADELEALCRRHNKWVRSPIAIHAPQLQEGDGSESGYEVRPTIDGFGYTINCRIGK